MTAVTFSSTPLAPKREPYERRTQGLNKPYLFSSEPQLVSRDPKQMNNPLGGSRIQQTDYIQALARQEYHDE